MKMITIFMFVFLINVSSAAINAIGYTSGFEIQPSQDWLNQVETDVEQDDYFQSSAVQDASANFGFGDFVKGFAIFIGTFALGVVVVPYTYMQFGMPALLASILSIPVYVVYMIGIAQFVSNRGGKGMV